MGCLVTIFSYLGYKNEIKELVTSMCRAGASFFHQHLDYGASSTDWQLSFPTKSHRYVNFEPKNDSNWYGNVDFTFLKEVYIHKKVALTTDFINFLNENHLKTKFKFRKLYFGLMNNENPDNT